MNIFSIIILLLMTLFNGAGFISAISNKNPDDFSQLLMYFCLPVAVGCIMMLLKKKLGFTIAIVALLIVVLGTYIREEATEVPFIVEIILLLVLCKKNTVVRWYDFIE